MAFVIYNTSWTTWSGSRDAEGYREYKIKFLLRGDVGDGPAQALLTPGLPLPGSPWNYGNDFDAWAFCRLNCTLTPINADGPGEFFSAEYTFSTKPLGIDNGQCGNGQPGQDPLLEPQKVSGSFSKYTEEAGYDAYGRPILNSAFEQMRGAKVEFDANRPVVKIDQNVADLELPLLAALQDTVNDDFLWGVAPRCIKLGSSSWERKFYGSCYMYYTRHLEFEINWGTWDRVLVDEGTKVLSGKWNTTTGLWELVKIGTPPVDPNLKNPNHYIRYQDRKGHSMHVLLDGAGQPYNPSLNDTVTLTDCGTGCTTAPKYWRVGNEGVLLTYTSGCTWVGTQTGLVLGGDLTYTLSYEVAIVNIWNLTITDAMMAEQAVYQVYDNGQFSCTRGGTLTKVSGDADFLGSVTLTAGGLPGAIPVQKYQSANFLLLNIPLVL